MMSEISITTASVLLGIQDILNIPGSASFSEFLAGTVVVVSGWLAAWSLVNHLMFRHAPRLGAAPAEPAAAAGDSVNGGAPEVSVLIPARDEGATIRETVGRVLASRAVDLEVVVLDDHSRDQTRDEVLALAAEDPRVRLVAGAPLPDDWCGKQFACFQLAHAARGKELLFLDADVRLEPTAIARAAAFRRTLQVDLLSGFPQQVFGSLGEQWFLSFIWYLLLSCLPFPLMRWTRMAGASAGCGQFFLTTRDAYWRSGGHAQLRQSLHDGVKLPRVYRAAGLRTDVFDASDIARCRMYHGLRETWRGLSKNATEGIGAPGTIVPFTLLLTAGGVVPAGWLLLSLMRGASPSPVILAATLLSLLPRALVAARFDRGWWAVPLHPLAITSFLALQWLALGSRLIGLRPQWRGRSYSSAKPATALSPPVESQLPEFRLATSGHSSAPRYSSTRPAPSE